MSATGHATGIAIASHKLPSWSFKVTSYSIPTRYSSSNDVNKPAIPQDWVQVTLEEGVKDLCSRNDLLLAENYKQQEEIERLKSKLALAELDQEYWQARADRYGSLDRLLNRNSRHLDEIALLIDSSEAQVNKELNKELQQQVKKERARGDYWKGKYAESDHVELAHVSAATGELKGMVAVAHS